MAAGAPGELTRPTSDSSCSANWLAVPLPAGRPQVPPPWSSTMTGQVLVVGTAAPRAKAAVRWAPPQTRSRRAPAMDSRRGRSARNAANGGQISGPGRRLPGAGGRVRTASGTSGGVPRGSRRVWMSRSSSVAPRAPTAVIRCAAISRASTAMPASSNRGYCLNRCKVPGGWARSVSGRHSPGAGR